MNIKSLGILVLILLAGAGAYFYSGTQQSFNASDNIGAAILPDLQAALNNIDELEVVGADNQVLSTVVRGDTGWTVKQRNAHPADISKVRAALLSLAEAKIVEEKTSNADLYSRLGVEDVAASEAQGVKAVVKYNNQLAELIVGNPGPQINKSRYVRPADSQTSWLVDRKIDLKHQPDYWLKKDILSVEPDEVASITITLQDGAVLEIANTDDENNTFEVTNLTDASAQVVDAELHQVANALSSFQLLDVVSDEEFKQESPAMNISYRLKSGANIDLQAYDVDNDHYAAVTSSLSADIADENKDAVQTYVEQINQVTSGWVYKIPNVTYDSMYKREADVLAITEDQLN